MRCGTSRGVVVPALNILEDTEPDYERDAALFGQPRTRVPEQELRLHPVGGG